MQVARSLRPKCRFPCQQFRPTQPYFLISNHPKSHNNSLYHIIFTYMYRARNRSPHDRTRKRCRSYVNNDSNATHPKNSNLEEATCPSLELWRLEPNSDVVASQRQACGAHRSAVDVRLQKRRQFRVNAVWRMIFGDSHAASCTIY